MIPKTAYASLKKQAEEIEAIDRAQAFEFGFAKAAHDLELSKDEYELLRKIAIAKSK